MKKLLTLALLLSSCVYDYDEIKVPCKMIVSKANPIELWDINDETYHEKVICGVHKDCFYQPWECDDPIKIQFQGDSFDYEVVIFDSAGNASQVVGMSMSPLSEPIDFLNTDFDTQLLPWLSTDPGPTGAPSWTWMAGGFARYHSALYNRSSYLYQSASNESGMWLPGSYVLDYSITNESSGGADNPEFLLMATFMDNLNDPGNPAEGIAVTLTRGETSTGQAAFTLTEPVKKLAFYVSRSGSTVDLDVDIQVDYLRLSSAPSVDNLHYASFSFDNLGNIPNPCDGIYQIKIRKEADIADSVEPAATSTTENITLVGHQIINGVQTVDEMRVLVKNQTNQTQNGVYLAFEDSWVRAGDANESSEFNGMVVSVLGGTVGQGTYTQTTPSVTLGSSNIVFAIYDYEYILKSDPLDVREHHECTVLANYSNDSDYADLIYDNISPAQSFYLRIPTDFWQERFQEEMETHDLSNNKTIALNSEVKVQKLMETDFLPMYFHKKLTLIMKHQTLLIDGVAYTQTEAYNIVQGNKKFSTKRGNVWLLEQDSVVRNTM